MNVKTQPQKKKSNPAPEPSKKESKDLLRLKNSLKDTDAILTGTKIDKAFLIVADDLIN